MTLLKVPIRKFCVTHKLNMMEICIYGVPCKDTSCIDATLVHQGGKVLNANLKYCKGIKSPLMEILCDTQT